MTEHEPLSVAAWHQLTPEERTALIDKEIALCETEMAEQHECDWEYDYRDNYTYCIHEGCTETLTIVETLAILNEYGTLKRATDELTVELAKQAAVFCMDDYHTTSKETEESKALRAYADILEKK